MFLLWYFLFKEIKSPDAIEEKSGYMYLKFWVENCYCNQTQKTWQTEEKYLYHKWKIFLIDKDLL